MCPELIKVLEYNGEPSAHFQGNSLSFVRSQPKLSFQEKQIFQ